MEKTIKIFDTTLRDGEQTPGVNLNIYEKLEIAKQLAKLGINVIEAGFAIASPGDFEAISQISRNVKGVTIASLSRALEKDIDRAWEAIKDAESPRIHTFLATSDIHMKYKLKMRPEEVLERAVAMVKYAKKYTNNVEFSAEDASRTDINFLYKVIYEVIRAGATVVNIPDTVGYSMPHEFGNLIKGIRENVANIDKIDISVHCHNDLGLAVANSLAALQNGATQLECTINGLGERAGNAALEEIVMGLNTRKDLYGVFHKIDTTQIYRTSKLVSSLTGISVQPNKAVVGANAFAHESGIHQHGVLTEKSTYEIMTPESIGLNQNKMVLGKLSGRHAFEERLKEMGYSLSKGEIQEAFEKFKVLADKKKTVLDGDIEALVEEKVFKVLEVYQIDAFQISSGNKIVSTATITLKRGDEFLTEAATGDGPIDAAFNAIERAICMQQLELVDYSLKAVTEGKDAQGEVTVRVSRDGKIYVGKGVSTDIIEASIKAYINAVNRIISQK